MMTPRSSSSGSLLGHVGGREPADVEGGDQVEVDDAPGRTPGCAGRSCRTSSPRRRRRRWSARHAGRRGRRPRLASAYSVPAKSVTSTGRTCRRCPRPPLCRRCPHGPGSPRWRPCSSSNSADARPNPDAPPMTTTFLPLISIRHPPDVVACLTKYRVGVKVPGPGVPVIEYAVLRRSPDMSLCVGTLADMASAGTSRMGSGIAAAAVALGVTQLLAAPFGPAADARTAVGLGRHRPDPRPGQGMGDPDLRHRRQAVSLGGRRRGDRA